MFSLRALIALLACAAACTPQAEQAAVKRPPDVEFAGCDVVLTGPRCVLSRSRELRLWVPGDAPLRARTDARSSATYRAEAFGDGQLYRVEVPEGATQVQLLNAQGAVVYALPLAREPLSATLERARMLYERGRHAEARSALDALEPSRLSTLEVTRAAVLAARIAYAQGDVQAALDGRQRGLEQAYRAGRISEAAEDATAIAYMLIVNLRRYAQARAVLERARRETASDPTSRGLVAHYLGVLAFESGDLRGALAQFRAAAEQLGRLHVERHAQIARQEVAETLATLGRYTEALQEQQRVTQTFSSSDACLLADRQEAVTWFALLSEPEPGSERAHAALTASQRSAALLADCDSAWSRRNHAINTLLLAVQLGDSQLAEAQLSWLDAQPQLPDALLLDAWEQEARGRAALARGDWDGAQRAFERERELSLRGQLGESQRLALLGLARAARGRKDLPRALASYEAAEALLDERMRYVPLGEGAATYQSARDAGARELMELCVTLGQPARALAHARAARARVLHASPLAARLTQLPPEERSRWEQAIGQFRAVRDRCEQAEAQAWRLTGGESTRHQRSMQTCREEARRHLDAASAVLQPNARWQAPAGPPPHDELLLAYFRTQRGVRAFSASDQGVRTAELHADYASELESQLLVPFRAQLLSAARVSVIADAALGATDFHALPLDGAPLAQRAVVRYQLDLQGAEREPTGHIVHALVVGDPSANLAAAQREARAVATQLQAAAVDVELRLRADATRAHLVQGMTRADLLHLAGHARYAGRDGMDSAIVLADGVLSIGDVLSVERVPATVVLSACEGARSEGEGFALGLGMAQAFVAAGASSVVAATRPVDDAVAEHLSRLFYESLTHSAPEPARALQRATLQLRAEDPSADWAVFRLLTP